MAGDTACALEPFWHGDSMGACNVRARVGRSLGNMESVLICDDVSWRPLGLQDISKVDKEPIHPFFPPSFSIILYLFVLTLNLYILVQHIIIQLLKSAIGPAHCILSRLLHLDQIILPISYTTLSSPLLSFITKALGGRVLPYQLAAPSTIGVWHLHNAVSLHLQQLKL